MCANHCGKLRAASPTLTVCLLVLHARPGGWLAVIGRAASPSEKTARPHIVLRLRDEVKRRGKSHEIKPESSGHAAIRCSLCRRAPRPRRCRAVRDSTLVAWYSSLYAPRTGGAHDSHHRAAGIAGRTRRSGGVAARVAGATAGDAGSRVSWLYLGGYSGDIARSRMDFR